MNSIKVLDCTLRDGGYVNNWGFGKENIKKICSKLSEANIDIIECGFLTQKITYSEECSKFDEIQEISDLIPQNHKNSEIVCMINYGEYSIDSIPEHNSSLIDGIRVAFHKKDLIDALEFCKGIALKGYKLFMQPMLSISYTDEEFLKLIKYANEIRPYAFYIVDSFGVMKKNDLMRLYYIVDHNLDANIYVGYHSHNNIQLAYSNAQTLVDLKTQRKLIIDSSVFGMGRGAGNLNTELFVEYLNDNNNANYKSKYLLQIIDEVLNNIYLSSYWGYSLPHYVSAMYNCHPNYASYLADKNTLTVEDISNILSRIDENKKNTFKKDYIEKLYYTYQRHKILDITTMEKLTEVFKDKIVVVIAPGRSINLAIDKISMESSKSNTITIALNFKPKNFKYEYVFASNLRRYDAMEKSSEAKFIITSNIKTDNPDNYTVDYSGLLNQIEAVEDNAGLMLIKLLIKLGVKFIKLAGYDGYSYDAYNNYAEKDMTFIKKNVVVDNLNKGIKKALCEYSKQVDIKFITKTKYMGMGED